MKLPYCKSKNDCIYKNITTGVCDYLISDKAHYYLYHLGEEPPTGCENPFKNIYRR